MTTINFRNNWKGNDYQIMDYNLFVDSLQNGRDYYEFTGDKEQQSCFYIDIDEYVDEATWNLINEPSDFSKDEKKYEEYENQIVANIMDFLPTTNNEFAKMRNHRVIKNKNKTVFKFSLRLNFYNLVGKKSDFVKIINVIKKSVKNLDTGVYDPNRKMRCVFTAKPETHDKPLELVEGTPEQTLIQYYKNNDNWIDFSWDDFAELNNVNKNEMNLQTDTDTQIDIDIISKNIQNMNDIEKKLFVLRSCFEKGEYNNWFKIGCILRHICDFEEGLRYFVNASYVAPFDNENEKEKTTKIFQNINPTSSFTLKSLDAMCQTINSAEYEKYCATVIENDDIEIDKLENGFVDMNVALYIYHHFCFAENTLDFNNKENQLFVSSGIKGKCQLWFSFKNGKWNAEKDGIVMCDIVSFHFYKKINDYYIKFIESIAHLEKEKRKQFEQKIGNLKALITSSRRGQYVNTIVNNLFNLCKINDFEEKLDLNSNLVCCNNGVIDLKNKCFREGRPSDMCSLSTNINYREDLSDNTIIEEIDDFFYKLFPQKSQRDYMLNHLASVFYGTTSNQSFNYYIGGGSNGKSQLVDLMSFVMGDYKGSVPLTLITQKRASIGGTSSEVMNLRGVRYAIIQEPSKNDTINEGVMKELTGGDPITARGLYKEAVTFKPMFDLAICSNIFLNITSNDHGTWRRIKVVEFGSKFVEDNVCDDDFIFKKDLNLNKKFDIWKEYLLYKLIQIAFQNEGKVGVYSLVQSATERYRISQDKVGQYINDMIVQSDESDAFVLKTSLSKSFKEWCENKYKYSIKAKDLYDRLDEIYDSNYVKYKGFAIKGVTIASDVDEDDIIDKDVQFITEFEKQYETTMDLTNDYVIRSNIHLWCKEKGLKIKTTKEITRVLSEKFKINCFNKDFCKKKRINGDPQNVIFGIKLK